MESKWIPLNLSNQKLRNSCDADVYMFADAYDEGILNRFSYQTK